MQAMRDVLRASLGRSLRDLRPEDRVAAAWTVACGRAMAEHASVRSYHAGTVSIEVCDRTWMQQMLSLRTTLERDLARVAGLPVSAIHFELKKP